MMLVEVTDIGFMNDDEMEDEVEFDTWDMRELADLWFEFCLEMGIITYVCSFKEERDD